MCLGATIRGSAARRLLFVRFAVAFADADQTVGVCILYARAVLFTDALARFSMNPLRRGPRVQGMSNLDLAASRTTELIQRRSFRIFRSLLHPVRASRGF